MITRSRFCGLFRQCGVPVSGFGLCVVVFCFLTAPVHADLWLCSCLLSASGLNLSAPSSVRVSLPCACLLEETLSSLVVVVGVMARSRRTNRAGLACQTHSGGTSHFSTVAVCGFCSCVGWFRAEDN